MLTSLGKDPPDEQLEGMIKEAPGPLNFTMFLTMFGEKLQGTDPEDVIKNAFACFDERNTGRFDPYLRLLCVDCIDFYVDPRFDYEWIWRNQFTQEGPDKQYEGMIEYKCM